jgi:hypothetical protein
MECIVKMPDGTSRIIRDGSLIGQDQYTILAQVINAPRGTFEVRWYGSEGTRRKFFEIARGNFTFDDGKWSKALIAQPDPPSVRRAAKDPPQRAS